MHPNCPYMPYYNCLYPSCACERKDRLPPVAPKDEPRLGEATEESPK